MGIIVWYVELERFSSDVLKSRSYHDVFDEQIQKIAK